MKATNRQRGQTLIETLVGIFILTIGLTSALGLANYALSASSNIVKQIIGMGLAREGLEAVKNMRDTNWLKDTLSTDCYNFETDSGDAACYRSWLKPPTGYDLDPPSNPGGKTMVLSFDASNNTFWQLQIQSNDFTLHYDSTAVGGLYTSNPGAPSGYNRRLTLAKDSTGPFGEDGVGPRLSVTSEVWWNDKRCPATTQSAPPSGGSCYIKLQTYLTNWKNY